MPFQCLWMAWFSLLAGVKMNVFFKKNIHLCIWLCWVLVVAYEIFSLGCGMWMLSCSMWDPSSLTRYWTQVPCSGSTDSWSLDHRESRKMNIDNPVWALRIYGLLHSGSSFPKLMEFHLMHIQPLTFT